MHQSIPHPAALSSRTLEKQALKSLLDRKGSQLVAVTGRRRVGKTFLVRNTIDKRSIFLEITGKKRASKVDLRDNFLSSYEEKFKPIAKLSRDLSWREIFKVLSAESKRSKTRDFTLFLDELPWMAQSDHDFLPALEHIWNNDWSQIAQFKLIVCGSAASWMNEHIFNNTDGLFGRLTGRLDLLPFTLSQCSEFSASRSLGLNSQQLLEYYLVLGGVPYYWTLIERDEPAAEFVQRSFFDKSPLLVNEFNLMLEALFRDSKAYGAIINALGKSRYGLSREELATVTKVSAGGTLERALNELCDCAFVTRYVPFNYAEKGMYFRLTDQFMLFNVVWLAKRDRTGVKSSVAYWHKQRSTGKYHNWIGSSFEVFCQKHIDAILLALGISGIEEFHCIYHTLCI